jgi:hypothetical protein
MQFTYSKTSYFPYIPPYYGENNIGPNVNTGPTSYGILVKETGGNAIMPTGVPGSSNQAIPKAMPQKFYPSMNDSIFSLARKTYIKDAGSFRNPGNGPFLTSNSDSSAHIKFKKIKALGKSMQPYNNQISFQGNANDTTVRNSSLSRVRGGGSVAPKKKGAIRNT